MRSEEWHDDGDFDLRASAADRYPVGMEKLAASEGTSLNQFVANAVAVLRAASYFAERRRRAD